MWHNLWITTPIGGHEREREIKRENQGCEVDWSKTIAMGGSTYELR